MNAELRKLSVNDGIDVYDMLQEIPKDENGFLNGCNGRTYEEFKKWLVKSDNISKGIGLEEWMVPQDTYWLYIDEQPVGCGKLRHYLTESLMEEGGHGGYAIRPSYRGKGYGKLLLKLLIEIAVGKGIKRLLLTVQNHNTASIKVALANDGIVEKITESRHYIWIDLHKRGLSLPGKVYYRKATIDDVEILAQLRKQQLNDEGMPALCNIDDKLCDYFESKISDNTFISWLAIDGGDIIATSGVCFHQVPPSYTNPFGVVAYITNMYTKKEHRRKGIATILLGRMLEEIKALDIHVIRLHASKDGRELYSKFGFANSSGYMVLKY